MKIRIITPGLFTTVQDPGRPGWRSAGVPVGGAADIWSHRLANLLTGNDPATATLEIAGGGFRAWVEQAGRLAVFGPGGDLWIDQMPVGNGRPVFVSAGSQVEIRASPAGNYAYLATSGGWDVPVVLGSRSTCLAAAFGGLEGRALRKGDAFTNSSDDFESSEEWDRQTSSKWFLPNPEFAENPVRVLPGPEADWWSPGQRELFFGTPFTVSTQRDRMGVRLMAPTLRKFQTSGGLLLSTAVTPGTVQIPPGGQPIVLLADAQTTGGYPRIAQVAASDLPRLTQMPPGKIVRFHLISLAEAERLFFEREHRLLQIQTALRLKA